MALPHAQAAALIETHQPELYRLAYSLTLDTAAAGRISAQSLLAGLRAPDAHLPPDVALARRVVDACRAHAAWVGLKTRWQALLDNLRMTTADGPAESGAAYTPSGIWQGYQRLGAPHQRVLALRYFHNYPAARVAVLLRSSGPGVRRLLGAARHRLDDSAGGPHGMLGASAAGLNHTQARLLLQSAVDLPLSGPPWLALQAHLQTCPACQAYGQRLDLLLREVGRALQPHLTPP